MKEKNKSYLGEGALKVENSLIYPMERSRRLLKFKGKFRTGDVDFREAHLSYCSTYIDCQGFAILLGFDFQNRKLS